MIIIVMTYYNPYQQLYTEHFYREIKVNYLFCYYTTLLYFFILFLIELVKFRPKSNNQ